MGWAEETRTDGPVGVLGPKGRNSSAQGNALGAQATTTSPAGSRRLYQELMTRP